MRRAPPAMANAQARKPIRDVIAIELTGIGGLSSLPAKACENRTG
jgi:hypothetical protein